MKPSLRRAHGPTVLVFRKIRGLTMDTVAERANISPGYLSKIERGLRRPEGLITARLATALDVDVEVLTGQKPAIAVIRDALGIEPTVFARDVGLTPGRLDRIERGLDIPDPTLRAVIARRLGVAADALDPDAFAAA